MVCVARVIVMCCSSGVSRVVVSRVVASRTEKDRCARMRLTELRPHGILSRSTAFTPLQPPTLVTNGTAIMTSTAAPTADTVAIGDVAAVFQGDEKTSEALAPVLESLRAMLERSDEKALSTASAAAWIASRDGESILRAPNRVLGRCQG